MARTPKRAGRQPPLGSHFASEIVARNIRGYRAVKGLEQKQVAALMSRHGHDWNANTVGAVERGYRNVTVDELVSVAAVLGVTVPQLLDPPGPGGVIDTGLFLGGGPSPLGNSDARYLVGALDSADEHVERMRRIALMSGLSNGATEPQEE